MFKHDREAIQSGLKNKPVQTYVNNLLNAGKTAEIANLATQSNVVSESVVHHTTPFITATHLFQEFWSLLACLLIIIVPVLIAVAFLTLAERKVLGYSQMRKGPNVVGIYGLLQPLADGIKLFSKELVIPSHSSLVLYFLSPVLALTLSLLL